LAVTHKVGTTGDIPVTNGLIELSLIVEHITKVRDNTDIPVIHSRTAIIVETNAKCEPPFSSLFSPRAHTKVESFAYP
jgi:hypothetical protein